MLKTESYRKGIVYSSLLNILSKLCLFFQSIFIAYYFGTTPQTDLFFFCLTIVTIISTFINALDYTVLIPESMNLYHKKGAEKSMQFLNFFICLYLFLGVLIALIVFFFPVNVILFISSFERIFVEKNYIIALYAMPLIPLSILTNFLSNILVSYKYFTMPIIATLINNLLALVFIIFFHKVFSLASIYLGLSIGYIINIITVVFIMKRRIKWNFSVKLDLIRKSVTKNIFFSQLGNITVLFVSYIPIKLMSSFDQGTISALTLGQKTSEVPTQIITHQATQVAAVKFNELFVQKKFQELNKIFNEIMEVLFFVLVPIGFLFFLFGDEIISFVFGRGKFAQHSVELTATFLKMFGFLLPFIAISNIFSRLIMAGQIIKQAAIYQVLFNLVLSIVIYFTLKLYGAMSYPITLNVLYFLNMLFYFSFTKFYFPQIDYKPVLFNYFKIVIANIIVVFFLFLIKEYLPETVFIKISTGSLIYILTIVLLNRIVSFSPSVNILLDAAYRHVVIKVNTVY